MTTRVVRLDELDVEYIGQVSGLPQGMPFSEKFHAVLRRLEGPTFTLADIRAVLREEIDRMKLRA